MGKLVSIIGYMLVHFFFILPLLGNLLTADPLPEGVDNTEFREVAKDLRCPTCTGLSILESDATFSNQLKGEVANQLKEGKSKDEILKFFQERYGPWILRAPPMEGVNVMAWLIPVGALLIGPFCVWAFVWRRKRQSVDFDLRSTDEILQEMQGKLTELRSKG